MSLAITREGAAVVWTIDRPETRNALGTATMQELMNAIANVGDARCAIITGAGGMFVSGGDLNELRGRNSREDATWLRDKGRELTQAIAELSIPVIAALDGAAIGGGAELAIACDLRVAATSATISFKQVRMGVTTAWGSANRLVSLVGAGVASKLLFLGTTVHAGDAPAGLFDTVVERDALGAAKRCAEEIAHGSPAAIASMKKVLRGQLDEREAFVETWSAPDHAEAMNAYFERRPARFESRKL